MAYAETTMYLVRLSTCTFAGVHSPRIYQLSMQLASPLDSKTLLNVVLRDSGPSRML
jgi:hypothetical protein